MYFDQFFDLLLECILFTLFYADLVVMKNVLHIFLSKTFYQSYFFQQLKH